MEYSTNSTNTALSPEIKYCLSKYKCFLERDKRGIKVVLPFDYPYKWCPSCRERRRLYNTRPEIKEKKSKISKKYNARPEIKEKIGKKMKVYDARPEIKEKRRQRYLKKKLNKIREIE